MRASTMLRHSVKDIVPVVEKKGEGEVGQSLDRGARKVALAVLRVPRFEVGKACTSNVLRRSLVA